MTLSDEEARRRGTQKTVLERKAPPTFDVVVEIQEKDRLAVHHRVDEAVDRLLRGDPVPPEVRVRTVDGGFRVEASPAREEAETDSFEVAPPRPSPGRRRLRILPVAVGRSRLERAIREVGAQARVVESLDDADLVVTLSAQERRQPRTLRDARSRGIRVAAVREGTVRQLEEFLRSEIGGRDGGGSREAALREAEEAIASILGGSDPIELSPQDRALRRLQHELAQRYGCLSESRGREPHRRVVLYRP